MSRVCVCVSGVGVCPGVYVSRWRCVCPEGVCVSRGGVCVQRGCVCPEGVCVSGVSVQGVYTSSDPEAHPRTQRQIPRPWTEGMTHACENITFPQLLLRAVIMK